MYPALLWSWQGADYIGATFTVAQDEGEDNLPLLSPQVGVLAELFTYFI